MSTLRIAEVAPDVIRPLRHAILRPHETLADQVYPGDDAPGAGHFAAFLDGRDEPVGAGAVTPEPFPGIGGPRPGDWRIRGMATDAAAGGRGIGAGGLILRALLEHARAHGAVRVWCNARTPARGFYERAGFAAEGDEFTLPDIGPHYLMWVDLLSSSGSR